MSKIKCCHTCGREFAAYGNGCYCSDKCKAAGQKIAKKKYRIKKRKKEHSAKVTIEDMVEETLRLSKELGRSVQYGDLQKMMYLGYEIKR